MSTQVLKNTRHWSSLSEQYATGDVLLRHLRMGWILENVELAVFPRTGYGQIHVYRFHLIKGKSQLQMSVVANPVVMRLVEESGFANIAHREHSQLVREIAY